MTSKTILVKAAPLPDPGLAGKARVVKEHTTRRYITEQEPIEVPDTPYYRRKIRKGELLLMVAEQAAPPLITPLPENAFNVETDDPDLEDDQ